MQFLESVLEELGMEEPQAESAGQPQAEPSAELSVIRNPGELLKDASGEPLSKPLKDGPRRNRGWFPPGVSGNPAGRGYKRVPTMAEKVKAWDGKGLCPVCSREIPPKSGRLMQESLSEEALRRCLANSLDSPYVLTLPGDARIVAVELDPAGGVVVIYRSEQFKPVQAEGPIPKLSRHHFGQRARSW